MTRRTPRIARLAGLIAALLLAAACGALPGATPDPAPAAPTAEPIPPEVGKPIPEVPTATVQQDANVREGPGVDHGIVFWLTTGTEITVRGRNVDGTWLHIEHEDRPGWIFATLTNFGASAIPGLPEAAAPTPEPQVAVAPTATPIPAGPDPEPEPIPVGERTPESEPEAASATWVTVTGNPVNVREGPGTDHPIALQAAAGDRFEVLARNADGSWLQVVDPRNPEGRLWIYGPLTDLEAAAIQTLAEVGIDRIGIEPPAQPEAEPAPRVREPATPQPVANCTRFHTVNPNETRLAQITDWFGLDLAAVAALNGLDADAPLAAGAQLCLAAGPAAQPPAAAPVPEPATPSAPAAPVALPPGTLWWPPGSYANVEGLDYDFEIEWRDESREWNWRLRDPAGCYDALRAFLQDLPERFGIHKFEVTLRDMPVERDLNSYYPGKYSFWGWYAQPKFSLDTVEPLWPDWEGRVRPDQAVAGATCEHVDIRDNTDKGVYPCEVFVAWGRPGHLLDGVAIHAIAKNMGLIGFGHDNDGASHWGLFAWDRQAYLTPVVNQLVVGHGACVHLTKQE